MFQKTIVITTMLLTVSRAFQHLHNPNQLLLRTSRCLMTTGDDAAFKNIISSPKSKSIKTIQNLLNKRKERTKTGQTVVEGPRILFDLLDNPSTKPLVRQIYISVEDYENEYSDRLSKELDIVLVTPEVLKGALSDTVTPQGIVAIVDIPSYDVDLTRKNPVYLVLDGVSDPGNVGTLLRSSLAVGCAGVVLLPGCCDVWNPKAVRSAMGTSFQLPIIQSSSWQNAVTSLKEWNVESVYAATMIEGGSNSGGSQPHFDINWLAHPSAIVIGSEGNGLSSEIRDAIVSSESNFVKAVHVPMCSGIESLNAAVCGSVILFEYSRQNAFITK